MGRRWTLTLRAWLRRPAWQDAALAAALLALCILANDPDSVIGSAATLDHRAAIDLGAPPQPGRGNDPSHPSESATADLFSRSPGVDADLWWGATGLTVAGVALRRRLPLSMLAVCTLAVTIHLAQYAPFMIIDLGAPLLLYTVAVAHRRTVSLSVLAVLLLAIGSWAIHYATRSLPAARLPGVVQEVTAVQVVPRPPPPAPAPPAPPDEAAAVTPPNLPDTMAGFPLLGSALIASWAIGSAGRSRRAYLDELHARAEGLLRERDQQAAFAVAAERGRISRELHDVVAHGLSVIVIQAQGAAAALDSRPADTRIALDAIVHAGRDSLADMRRVLAAVGDVDDAWHPQPGLDRLPALLARVRTAGTPVDLRVDGTPARLPSAVDLSAYRIVQEALTNTMKHAGPGAEALVVLSYRQDEVLVKVSDDGQGGGDQGGGVQCAGVQGGGGGGLPGMRERARLLGGDLTAGPDPGGGFTVRATIPIHQERA